MWEELQSVPGAASATEITFKKINELYLHQQPLASCAGRRECPKPGFWGVFRAVLCPYHLTLLQVWVAPSGDPATMGTWMGLCCLFITRSSFSSRDLQVASRASSLASMLSSLRHMVWLMEYRNDCGGRRSRVKRSEFIPNPKEAPDKRDWEPILKELAACPVTKSTPDDIQERLQQALILPDLYLGAKSSPAKAICT